MAARQTASFGSWKSPVTADLIVSSTVKLGKVCLDGDDVYWLETRPEQSGRDMVVCCRADGTIKDVTPMPFNARTRVHEFGGGGFSVKDGKVYFTNAVDQRIYRQVLLPTGEFSQPEPLTPEPEIPGRHLRFADIACDPLHKRLICVQEDHTRASGEPLNSLVAVRLDGGQAIETLVSGSDFYSSPRLSPDGSKLAWLSWNHPHMPWDAAELWVASLSPDGSVAESTHIAGSEKEAIFQPEWASDGTLHFVSDRTGWWNIYRLSAEGEPEPLCQMEAEFGMPHWYFGHATYAFSSAKRIICAFSSKGIWQLGEINTDTKQFTAIDTPFQEITFLRANSKSLVFRGGAPDEPIAIVRMDTKNKQPRILRSSLLKAGNGNDTAGNTGGNTGGKDTGAGSLAQEGCKTMPSQWAELCGYLSYAQAVEFPGDSGLAVNAFYYKPCNKDYTPPQGELPPLLVRVHGGPNNATFNTLDLMIQYWTSRGFAVLDVNYSGSSGYGRAYRERLKGKWGILDVQDCVDGALYLVKKEEVDVRRLAIAGGSAGGYATINAVTFHDTFAAGAAQFGVSDMETMAGYFHKFEARYLDSMIGPFPERQDLYAARSAINFVDRISCPLILTHGLEDTIVPPDQSRRLAEALRARKKPFAHIEFAGEPHVFRQGKNVKRALEAELYFFCQAFALTLPEAIPPVTIENRSAMTSAAVAAGDRP